MSFSSLKSPKDRTLRAQVARELREAIISGDLPAGTRLIEKDLAAQFDMSRGPLREALRELEEDGLVETKPHAGSAVRAFSREELADTYALRRVLERFAFELVWERRGAAFFDDLDQRHDALLDAIRSGSRRNEDTAELSFHGLVFEHSENRPLLETWERLSRRIAYCFAMYRPAERSLETQLSSHVDYVRCAKGDDLNAMLAEIDRHANTFEPKFSEMVEAKSA
ncbi:MAG: GntR family transcriptional regulator [Hyphomicrobiales bacterium]